MKKVIFVIESEVAGGNIEDVISFDDDVTEEEIEKGFQDWKENVIVSYWDYVGEDGK